MFSHYWELFRLLKLLSLHNGGIFEFEFFCINLWRQSELAIHNIVQCVIPWFNIILLDKIMKCSTKGAALRKKPHGGSNFYLSRLLVILGIINNRKQNIYLELEEYPVLNRSNNLLKYDPTYYLLLFHIFLCAMFLSMGNTFNHHKTLYCNLPFVQYFSERT